MSLETREALRTQSEEPTEERLTGTRSSSTESSAEPKKAGTPEDSAAAKVRPGRTAPTNTKSESSREKSMKKKMQGLRSSKWPPRETTHSIPHSRSKPSHLWKKDSWTPKKTQAMRSGETGRGAMVAEEVALALVLIRDLALQETAETTGGETTEETTGEIRDLLTAETKGPMTAVTHVTTTAGQERATTTERSVKKITGPRPRRSVRTANLVKSDETKKDSV